MIKIDHVSKTYDAAQALTDINLEIAEGTCFGLVGPNGAGKSTLMKILAGIILDFDGDMFFNGHGVSNERMFIKKQIGYIPQDICLEETLTARDNLLLFGHLYGLSGKKLHERIEAVLEQIGLTNRSKDVVLSFSGGMKRRLNIGCALLHEPAVIIMDEPTVGIDPQSRNSIFTIIKQLKAAGSTIIYSSHYMEEVEQLCDSVGLIDKGRVVEGGQMQELLERHGKPSLFISGDAIGPKSLEPLTAMKKGDGYLVNSEDPMATLEQLIASLRSQDIKPKRLELYYPRLEDIFFTLTGTQLRDV
ncbi:ABC transporter ATP-binding protein [Sediminibacillus albus]|uniref:ABC-2 type transport system ATP-binding protein n=1 Tax=Sediminibacillus albus TaxID=407036 RepID=A0A1G8WXD8_9BACI|nr:ABC transporter ATP-binding protein [Sediminibacillus albus]SDJ83029.1 ABC-2 type transport system ATP-binding protein [Sediminibacillus albus]